MNMKKLNLFGIVLLLMVGIVFGAENVLINEVLYDPIGTDTGKEFIELYNPTDSDVSLENWSIETGNGANADDWSVGWTGIEGNKIRAGGYFLIGESGVNDTDYSVNLDLQNGPDSVRLKDGDGGVIDTLGWGTHTHPEYYEGTPTDDVDEGISLERISGGDTDNNSADFIENTEPSPKSSLGVAGNEISFGFVVEEYKFNISSVDIMDDDNLTEGIQICPYPGENRTVDIDIIVENTLGNSSVYLMFEGKKIDLEQTGNNSFHGNLNLEYHRTAANYELKIFMDNEGLSINKTFYFEYLSLSAISIDTNIINFENAKPGTYSYSYGDDDFSSVNRTTLKNIGNTAVDIGIEGGDFKSGESIINMDNLAYSEDTTFSNTMSEEMDVMSLGLATNSMHEMNFRLYVPFDAKAGQYTGKAVITAFAG